MMSLVLFILFIYVAHIICTWFITDLCPEVVRKKQLINLSALSSDCKQQLSPEDRIALGTWSVLILFDLILNIAVVFSLCSILRWIAVVRDEFLPGEQQQQSSTKKETRNQTVPGTVQQIAPGDFALRSTISQTKYDRALKTLGLMIVERMCTALPILIVELLTTFQCWVPPAIAHVSVDLLMLRTLLEPILFLYGIRSIRLVCLRCWCRGGRGGGGVGAGVKRPDSKEHGAHPKDRDGSNSAERSAEYSVTLSKISVTCKVQFPQGS
ncbi:unnamed protein product [Echinostoma caproni]|uniref:Anoctamin n=1 Tax=Echinostoma caproni TaxID=27848 RepID=A0A183AXF4_9TREM|nr:unnamed protein product [Echinostoma caproni]